MKGMYLEYNSPVKIGEKMKITLRISNDYGFVSEVKALFNRYGEKPGGEATVSFKFVPSMSNQYYSSFVCEKSFNSSEYHTFFISAKINGEAKKIVYDSSRELATFEDEAESPAFWECFSYYSFFETPEWVKGGIMYQIFVDTFCCESPKESVKSKLVSWDSFPKWEPDEDGEYRNNQYYGGNLKGIISKLPFIKSLNVTVIYLTPIFKGGSSNRYDTIDYEQIDEMVGTFDDLKALRNQANSLGIKVILDVVFNHSSSKNLLIKQDPEMYSWKEKYTVPNCWWGYRDLVEFNKNSPNYFKNLEKWLKLYSEYVDGIRLDVADELPDHVLRFIRNVAKSCSKDFYILGEVWKNAVTGDHRGFLNGDELDGVMNYQFSNAIYRYVRWRMSSYFKDILGKTSKLYPPESLDVSPIFLSSHDIPRIPNILVGDFMKQDPNFENVWSMEQDGFWYSNGMFDTYKFRSWERAYDELPEDRRVLAKSLQKVAVFMQYTLPGIPSIFAGDEVFVTGYKDPFNRKSFPWDNIDKEILDFYIQMGTFRAENRKAFADSANFRVEEANEKSFIYRRGNLRFKIDLDKMSFTVEV